MELRNWTIRMGGHVQTDWVGWASASPAIVGDQNYFEFRRLRLVADGVGYGNLDFRLQMTLEPEAVGESPPGTVVSPDVKDAYLTVHHLPVLGRLRAGNFFVPFGLEQVTNDTNNVFLERSIPTQGIFTPDREVGVAFYNANADETLTWAGGVFLDSISEGLKERIDDNQGLRMSGRLTWLPWASDDNRELLHTGIGILHTDDQDSTLRFRTRPQVHEGPRLIDSGPLSANRSTTFNLEAARVYGPWTLQGEAYLTTLDPSDRDQIWLQGAYLHSSWFLTGENRQFDRFGQHGAQFGRNRPSRDWSFRGDGGCDPQGQGLGAWELKARWSWLDLHQAGAGQYHDLTCGFNWYWNERTRIMFDWIHPMTSADTVFGSTRSDLLGLRLDFNW